jgi:[ribosomal protein S5]-alanine N-acetyltransferase
VNIRVNDFISLSEFRHGDQAALVEHLQEKEIYDRTLRIPYPYRRADADWWIDEAARLTARIGQPVQFALRNEVDYLIGGCGLDGLAEGKTHRAEIGYWLARPYWGRGIMTAAVRALCDHAFAHLGLVKITAHVFAGNSASARVLLKCGFEQEGYLRKHYCKDGQYLDALLFSRLG